MPIDASIISQAQNIPQIRYQPESQFESFAKIQPTLNAMQQMRQAGGIAAKGMRGQQGLARNARRLAATIQRRSARMLQARQTQAQMELGRQDGESARAARADQRPSVVAPGSALISPAGKELYRAPVDQNRSWKKCNLATEWRSLT
jgi:hypothetical protein